MNNLRNQRSYAFVIAYLLGVEDRVLYRDYAEEYDQSDSFAKFKEVPQAELLRALSRVKQSFLRNHHLYNGVVRLSAVTKGHLDNELAIISNHGIDLAEVLMTKGNIYEVINTVSLHINLILTEVLEYLGVPYIEQIKSLFYLYNVDRHMVTKLMSNLRDSWHTLPHGIIIVKANRISRDLPYILQNDRNLFFGVHEMNGLKAKDDMEIPPFSWDNVGQALGVRGMASAKQELSVERLKWQSISKGSAIYVDCENIDIFSFLSMLEVLDGYTEAGASHEIKLFLDSQVSPLWRMVDKLVSGKYSFEFIEVGRIKETKSVVDVVITAHVTRDVYEKGYRDIGILSSDSDFYGLIEFLKDVNIYVGYNGENANLDYLHYLSNTGCVSFNMENLTLYDRTAEYKKTFLAYMGLNHLASLPMAMWAPSEVSEWLVNTLGRDVRYSPIFQKDEIESLVTDLFVGLKVEMVDSKIKLSSLDAEVEVALGLA